MLNLIDSYLSKITMYRLILYYLTAIWIVALILSAFKILPFGPLALIISTLVLIAVSLAFNQIFSVSLKVQPNVESVYITALILAFIISPVQTGSLTTNFGFLFWAGALAMASKYIVTFRNKHIFNPVAFSVAVTALTINQSASWWVGTAWMFGFVLVGGFLIIRKVQRTASVLAFTIVTLLTSVVLTLSHTNFMSTTYNTMMISPLVFFVAVMFTEPLTMPPTRNKQIIYGILVGILFAPQFHIGSFSATPEIALLIGNVLSFFISPKGRAILTVKEIKEAGAGIYDFIFTPDKTFPYKPGQFMEWNLGQESPDNRGNRRYLTLASSPTEDTVRIGVKFYEKPSTFKTKLISMKPGDIISASQLAGDFVLPEDKTKKLVFVAGGIGITPFRSMLKYLVDKNEKRLVTVLYSCPTVAEIAYRDVLEQSAKKIGARIVITLTNKSQIPPDWQGCLGYITPEMIIKEIPDFKDRVFYISGPHSMVCATENVLKSMNVSSSHIKTDFFPGLA
jgi:glycine betaine catabolism B